MAYTVTISGEFNAGWCYATINGTKITEDNYGTHTYDTKPTISIRVGSYDTNFKQSTVTLNGEVVFTGRGTYDLVTDGTDINIVFTLERVSGTIYSAYFAEVTTRTPDPMAPHDGHNTNIGQVARQIEGGTVRLGGVGREIGSGLTLVNGVAREIPFATPVQVVISGAPYSGRAYATINGTAVYNAGTYEYEEMPTISVYVAGANTSMSQSCKVTLDGQTVLSGKGTYNLNVDANKITIEFTNKGSISMWVYICDITTE